MATPIRVVYENGLLRPLGPVEFVEGQQYELILANPREQFRAAASDLLAPPYEDIEDLDEKDAIRIQHELDQALKELNPPLSQTIIDDRNEDW